MTARVHRQRDGSVRLSLPYQRAFVAALKQSVPSSARTWDKPSQTWTVDASYARDAITLTARHFPASSTPQRATGWAEALFAAIPPRLHDPAYRALLRVLHPDIGGDTRAAQQLNDAHAATLREDSVSALDTVLDALRQAGCNPQANGSGWKAKCPAHADEQPSLSVGTGDSGKVLLKCFAGCDYTAVLDALHLDTQALRDSAPRRKNARQVVETYDYTDEDSNLLFQVVRYEPKDFRQRRPDGQGGWTWKLGGSRRVLYRLPAVLAAAQAERTVHVVEGERDVHSADAAGAVATTAPMGAGKWRDEYAQSLKGAQCVVVADRDEPGRQHAAQVADSLRQAGIPAQVVEPAAGKDLTDHLQAGHTLDELVPQHATSRGAQHESGLLDQLEAFYGKFVVYPDEHALVAHVLWTAHSHAYEAFDSTPRLAFLSPERRCGKTRALELTQLLCRDAWHAFNATPAATIRLAATGTVTLLLDEADTIWTSHGKSDRNEDLRALVNAGHRRGAVAARAVAGNNGNVRVDKLPAFCPVALAGIGDLPTTILDRSIIIRMRRRTRSDKVASFRFHDVQPETQRLRDQLADWAAANFDQLTAAWPDLPDGLVDRAADCWAPLLAIADSAGGTWPQRARDACKALTAEDDGDAVSLGERLLTDIRTAFDAEAASALFTTRLLQLLKNDTEAPWATLHGTGLDPRGLASRLRAYGIHSRTLRDGERKAKGYQRGDFLDAWNRYTSGNADTDNPNAHFSGASVASVAVQVSPATDTGLATDASVADESSVAVATWDDTDATDATGNPTAQQYLTAQTGRCTSCGWHPPTQGHEPGCPQSDAPVIF